MSRTSRRALGWLFALVFVVALCLVFPRAAAFVELAAREIRYLWWLILIAAMGIYLTFFFGRRRGD